MRHAAIFTALALALLGASHAHAQEQATDPGPSGTLRFGKYYAFGGGADIQHGFGLDLRYELYPEAEMDGYFGVLAQGEYQTSEAWRFVGGVTGGWGFFGLELGVSHRTAASGYAGTTGIHIGQSFTFGPISIGGRLTVPLVDHIQQNVTDPPAVQGVEGAVVLRMSFGLPVHGQRRGPGAHCHGQGHAAHGNHGE